MKVQLIHSKHISIGVIVVVPIDMDALQSRGKKKDISGCFIRLVREHDFSGLMKVEESMYGAKAGYCAYAMRMHIELHHKTFFVAEDKGDIVGYVVAAIDVSGTKTAWILSLVVAKKYQRMGLGRTLAEVVLQALKSSGVTEVRAFVQEKNPAGRAFFQRLNFQQLRYAQDYFGPGKHRYIVKRSMD